MKIRDLYVDCLHLGSLAVRSSDKRWLVVEIHGLGSQGREPHVAFDTVEKKIRPILGAGPFCA